jgi:hypothetical protein
MPRAEEAEGLLPGRGGAADGCVAQELRRPRIPLGIVAFLFLIVIISSLVGNDDGGGGGGSSRQRGEKVAVELYSAGAPPFTVGLIVPMRRLGDEHLSF